MNSSDKERYSISKVGKDTFVLTDTDTSLTWQIEVLRNSYKNQESTSSEDNPTMKISKADS